jgi:hypothetical protein
MSAQPASAPAADRSIAGTTAAAQWARIEVTAPQLAVTMRHYLQRLAAFQAPASVVVADNALRIFAGWMLGAGLDSVAAVRRDDIEDFKVWLANKPNPNRAGATISPDTHWQRLRVCAGSSNGSSSGSGPTPRPATRCSTATSRRNPNRCRSSSTTGRRPSSRGVVHMIAAGGVARRGLRSPRVGQFVRSNSARSQLVLHALRARQRVGPTI